MRCVILDRKIVSTKERIKSGEEHEVEIHGLTHDGEGVGRIGSLAVFVPDAMPGDSVRIRIISSKKSYARGLITQIVQPSSQRKTPLCPVATNCGGCQLQYMEYETQLFWKKRQVEDAFTRIAKLNVEVRKIKGMEDPAGYRNKGQFPIGMVNNQVIMGFYRKRTHEIVDLDACMIQHPLTMKLSLAVKSVLHELGIEPYNEKTRQGVIRHVVTRVSFSEDTLMVTFVTNTAKFPQQEELIQKLIAQVPELVSIAHNINTSDTNVIFGDKTKILWGQANLIDTIGYLKFAISPRSFFQVNPVQTHILYDEVKKAAALTGAETVWDLYCGIGTIGLYIAEDASELYGVEEVKEAVEDARHNARLNGITDVQFLCGKAEQVVPDLIEQGAKVDVVLLDPPRKGCEVELLSTISQLEVPKIVYVSCNPSSLARDVAYLVEQGYEVGYVQPVDMFPHTSHVECVVVLER